MYEPPVELYQKVSPILQEKLDYSDIDKLKEQLSNLQSIRYDISYYKCKWYKKLLDAREKLRVPKDKELTELDRHTMLGKATSMLEEDYNFLVSLEEIAKSQIELGMTFLAS